MGHGLQAIQSIGIETLCSYWRKASNFWSFAGEEDVPAVPAAVRAAARTLCSDHLSSQGELASKEV